MDVRLTTSGGMQGGSLVRSSDTDLKMNTTALTSQYCYTDNLEDGYALPDDVYLNVGARCDFVNSGDLRLRTFTFVGPAGAPSTTTSTSTSGSSSGPTVTTTTTTTTTTVSGPVGPSTSPTTPGVGWLAVAGAILALVAIRRRL